MGSGYAVFRRFYGVADPSSHFGVGWLPWVVCILEPTYEHPPNKRQMALLLGSRSGAPLGSALASLNESDIVDALPHLEAGCRGEGLAGYNIAEPGGGWPAT